jgi:hypothetical protein
MQTPPDPSQPSKRRGFPFVIVGGLAALAAGLGAAWVLVGQGDGDGPPPAAEGGLVIDANGPDDGPALSGKLLRCFVAGQFVGELSLTDCAKRNGVATDALDVGLDSTGALAAAEQVDQNLIPLPPLEAESAEVESALPAEEAEEAEVEPVSGPAACWRHGGGRWRKVASDSDIDACVQTLFAGRCEKANGATYGRFGQQTLRLVAGKVEVSDDNRNFRTLVAQAPDCAIPPVG